MVVSGRVGRIVKVPCFDRNQAIVLVVLVLVSL